MVRGKQSVSLVEQSHGTENRQILRKLTVESRLPSSQFGIVHGRQVIEDERAGVDHFKRGGRVQQLLTLRPARFSG